MAPHDSSSESLPAPVETKETMAHVEQVHTNEKVPGHPGYYEKNGLRTYGDDEDHDHEPPVCAVMDKSKRGGSEADLHSDDF